MPWTPLDDGFYSHRKVVAAGLEAVGLYCRALSWCGANLTDGHIPASIVREFAGSRTRKLAQQLVEVGLWQSVTDGWRIHGWAKRNPSADAVRAAQDERVEQRRRAGRAGAQARWKPRSQPAHSTPDGEMANAMANGMANRWRPAMRLPSETPDQRVSDRSTPPPDPPLGLQDTAELSTYGKSPGPSPKTVLGPVPKATRARNVQDQDQDQEIAGQDVFGAVRAARERAGLGTAWWHDHALKVSLEVARNSHPNLETSELKLALVTIASWRETRSPNRLTHVVDQALREAHSNGHRPSSPLPPLPPTVAERRARGDLGNQP